MPLNEATKDTASHRYWAMLRRKAKKRKSKSLESQSNAKEQSVSKAAIPPPVQPSKESPVKPTVQPTGKAYPKLEPRPQEGLGSQATNAEFNVVETWRKYWGQGLLADWQRLCRDLGVAGDLSSKKKCKAVCLLLLPPYIRADTDAGTQGNGRNMGQCLRLPPNR